jgi:uncharacterized membrane protein (DUF2068 family)
MTQLKAVAYRCGFPLYEVVWRLGAVTHSPSTTGPTKVIIILPMKSSHNRLIRLIALFKLLKAVLLLVLGIGALQLIHRDFVRVLEHWIATLGLDPGSRYVNRALETATTITPNKIKGLGVGSFLYAALFLTEGIGLWLERHWAEWFTVIVTSSLVPFEIFKLYQHASPIKIVLLILNIAVVAYFVHRIGTHRSDTP